MESNPRERKLAVVLMGECSKSTMKEHFVPPKSCRDALLLKYAQGYEFEKISNNFLGECKVWSTLRHPCVVQFLGKYIADILIN